MRVFGLMSDDHFDASDPFQAKVIVDGPEIEGSKPNPVLQDFTFARYKTDRHDESSATDLFTPYRDGRKSTLPV
jgi:hypothetical protein